MVISRGAYLEILAALVAERLFELRLSARHTRRALADGAIEVARGQYRIIAVFHAAFIISAAGEVLILDRSFPGLLGWAALGASLLAQALRYWCIFTLGERWNTRVIVWPALPPITRGPYRYLRHPNYLAVTVEMAAAPLIHGGWLTAVIFSLGNAILLRSRIRTEETALGAGYQNAFKAHPHMLPAVLRKLVSIAPR